VHPKRLVMWGYLTVHGVDRLCVGTCEPGKGDPEKELVGDLLRNGAMRFGIGTKLWSKATDADPAGSGQAGFRRNRKAEPATPEPAYEQPTAPSAGSVALYARVHATKGTPMADVLRGFAADEAKSLTARTFDADPTFADQVAAILDTARPDRGLSTEAGRSQAAGLVDSPERRAARVAHGAKDARHTLSTGSTPDPGPTTTHGPWRDQ
jgi:hypothetical protein